MAWTLLGFEFDVLTLVLPPIKAIGGAVCGLLFKKLWGYVMSDLREPNKCKIKGCKNFSQPTNRGLCHACYKVAKSKVQSGEVTWERLNKLGLCDLLESEKNAFDSAYEQAMETD